MNGVHIGYFENCGDSVETGFVLRPEGAQLIAQGEALGNRLAHPVCKPQRGATAQPRRDRCALSGLSASWGLRIPGLRPWAIECAPSGLRSTWREQGLFLEKLPYFFANLVRHYRSFGFS